MSANNQVLIRRLTNGLYDIRDIDVDATADYGVDEGTNVKIASDIDGLEKAMEIANTYLDKEWVEYGLNIL